MAHFVNMIGVECGEVIVISNADIDDLPFPESEPVGQTFIAALGLNGDWLQTSYNGNFRGIYAGPGYTFNASLGEYGEFIAPEIAPA
jgi:hypothetical protein